MMDKRKKNSVNSKEDNLIKIFDLLPKDNVKGGNGKIVFGEVSYSDKKSRLK